MSRFSNKKNSFVMEVSFTIFFVFLCNCNNVITPAEEKNISVSFRFPSFNGIGMDSTIVAFTDSTSVPDKILINNKAFDFKSDNLLCWKILKSESVFIIEIVYKNQKYLDTLTLPNKIDSVFCNNTYIYNNLTDSSTPMIIDASQSYTFTWKPKNNIGYYFFEYQGMNENKFVGNITPDTFFTIERINFADTNFDFNVNFNIRIFLDKNLHMPYKSINNITTYYQWESQKYASHFFIEAQE